MTSDLLAGRTLILAGFNVVNPRSTRSFTVTLRTSYLIGGITYGIDSRTNTYRCNSGTLTSASISLASFKINALTTYTLTFTISNQLTLGSSIGVMFPSIITLGTSCSSPNSSLSCSISNSTYANISVSSTIAASSIIRITFSSVKNANQAQTSTSLSITTYYDSLLDSLVDTLSTGLTIAFVSNELTSNVIVLPSSSITYALSDYTFSVKLLDGILSGGYITITFPSQVNFLTPSISTANFPISSCVLNISATVISINNCFSSDLALLGISFTLSGFRNPSSFQPTTSFSINTFGPIGRINFITSGLIVTMT